MSELNIGGRGKKTPYETKQARIPVPLDNQVAEIKKRYLQYLESGGDVNNPPNYLIDPKPIYKFSKTKIGRLIEALERLVEKIDAKQTSYKSNSFTQGILDLKEIYKLAQKLKDTL